MTTLREDQKSGLSPVVKVVAVTAVVGTAVYLGRKWLMSQDTNQFNDVIQDTLSESPTEQVVNVFKALFK